VFIVVIKFSEINTSLGTRKLGNNIREQVIMGIGNKPDEKVIFDFEDIEVISHSFADECFGKLVEIFGLEKTKQHTTFKNTNNIVSMVIKQAIQERLSNVERPFFA
jgi:hypothetical protein